MPPTKPPTKTTKAPKKTSKAPTKAPAKPAAKKAATPSKAPAKKAPASKPAAKPAAKKVAKAPAKTSAKPAPKKAAKVAKKATAKAASKPTPKPASATKAATKASTKPAATPPKKVAQAPTKPATKPVTKPVKVGIAEGTAPLVTLTRADATPTQPKDSRTPKRNAASLRYVNDAESDQTRGSVDELDSLDVIETEEDDAADQATGPVGNADAEAEADSDDDDTDTESALSDRDAIAAGPDGDEPLLTTRERAARKIEHTPETTRAFAIEVARALADDKCTDLVVLDVRNLSSLSDYIVVGSGTSDRQMHFSIKNIVEMASTQGHQVARTSSDDRKTWLIADFVDVIIHLFEPNTRAHYDIEMLWGDAPRVEWERPDQVSRDRAGLGTPGPARN